MSPLWQTVLTIIGSIGGTGAIIIAIVKFTSENFAKDEFHIIGNQGSF